MSNDHNGRFIMVWQEILSSEIESLKKLCFQICNESECSSVSQMNPEKVREKALCYIRALHTEIQNTETPITTNEEVLIYQFLSEITKKTKQLDELTIFTEAAVNDVQTKIDSLKNQIKIAEGAKCYEEENNKQELIKKLKLKFRTLKVHVQNIIQSIFPEDYSEITNLMAALLQELTNDESSGYIPITHENFRHIEMLKEIDLVKFNPYNKNEVGLDC